MQFTEGKGSPELYRRWSAIFLVGAILERKVWVTTTRGKWYPNQYILFVGPAGIGKSLCTHLTYELLEAVRTPERPLFIAPTSVTKASLIDRLMEAERRVIRPMDIPSINQFNSLTVIANEFAVFLPAWDGEFMGVLTDIWDNKRYAESRRTSRLNIEILNPQLNILSATTPAQLTNLLPEGAWEQGFMSRMIIVYSGETIYTDFFAEQPLEKELRENLEHDLRDMYSLWGELSFADETIEAFRAWDKSGRAPVPDHPKLYSYTTRRPSHLFKLMIIASIADSSDMVITLEHYQTALAWLVELETYMPDVFKSMKVGGDGRAIEDCWHYAYQLYMKGGKTPVPEHKIWNFLQERVPAHSIERIIDVMCRAKLLEKKLMETGGYGYVPKVRKDL